MQETNNVKKTNYGSEITWADTETYHAKIHLFQKKGNKTPFIMHKNTEKTWFVNAGKFRVRYVNTENGEIFEAELPEGHVWTVNAMTPASLTCISDNGSITEVGNGVTSEDTLVIISDKRF